MAKTVNFNSWNYSCLQVFLQRPYTHPVTLEADVTPNCNLSSTLAFHWSVDGHLTGKGKKVLVLPPGSLSKGNHSVVVKVLGSYYLFEKIYFYFTTTNYMTSQGCLRRIILFLALSRRPSLSKYFNMSHFEHL